VPFDQCKYNKRFGVGIMWQVGLLADPDLNVKLLKMLNVGLVQVELSKIIFKDMIISIVMDIIGNITNLIKSNCLDVFKICATILNS